MNFGKRSIAALAILGVCSLANSATLHAQASLSVGGYTQTFDATLGLNGTALPTGFRLYYLPGDDTTYGIDPNNPGNPPVLPNGAAVAGAIAHTEQSLEIWNTVDDPRSFRPAANAGTGPDRMIGTSPRDFAADVVELHLRNDTGTMLADVSVRYTLKFLYATPEEIPGYNFFYSTDGITWNAVAALNSNFIPDVNGTPRVVSDRLSLSSAIGVGQEFRLRWIDDNARNVAPDSIYGLDDLQIVGLATPEPGTLALAVPGLAILGFAVRRRKSQI